MANMRKFGKSASGHLMKHFERAKENGEYIRFGNQEIDLSRTEMNYNLAPDRGVSQLEYMDERLTDVKMQKRDDLKVMVSWIVTLPTSDSFGDEKIYTEEEKAAFFQESYDFIADRYGEDKIISCYVHKDEVTDHFHCAILPVVPDKKWNEKHPEAPREKLSAKEFVTKWDLDHFHVDLQERLDKKFGEDFFPVLNGATEGGNRTIVEMKAENRIKALCEEMTMYDYDTFDKKLELEAVTKDVEKASEELKKVKDSVVQSKAEKDRFEGEVKGLLAEIPQLRESIEELRNEYKVLDSAIKKKNDEGQQLFGMDRWRTMIQEERQKQAKESKDSLLARFAEMVIERFPQLKQLWEQFVREEMAKRNNKKKEHHEWEK